VSDKAWGIIVVIAVLAVVFVLGLLIGHYVWHTHTIPYCTDPLRRPSNGGACVVPVRP